MGPEQQSMAPAPSLPALRIEPEMGKRSLHSRTARIASEGMARLRGKRLAPLERLRHPPGPMVVAAKQTIPVGGHQVIAAQHRIGAAPDDQSAACDGQLRDQIRIITSGKRARCLANVRFAPCLAARDFYYIAVITESSRRNGFLFHELPHQS